MFIKTINNVPVAPLFFWYIWGGDENNINIDHIENQKNPKINKYLKGKNYNKKYQVEDLKKNIQEIQQRIEVMKMKKEETQRKKDNMVDIMNVKVSKATDPSIYSEKD